MNFCSHCGARVGRRIPPGDNLPRHVCDACGAIHYQNPKIVAGCIVECDAKILLCRRAIEPRRGLWTIPAGFMENGETAAEAAVRETLEEARAEVEDVSLYALYNIPHISQVYLMFRARLARHVFAPGPESLDVALFEEGEIPWDEVAFRVVTATLQRYCEDRRGGDFPTHVGDIPRR